MSTPLQRDRRSLGGMATAVLLLNLVGWGVLLVGVVPQQLAVGDAGLFGVGLGVTAFLLGVRHAFDADHIAAIDNTTRKLVGENRPALSVGFWFSLGHSSVVFALSLALALGLRSVAGPVADHGSALHVAAGLVGPLVAGAFLLAIGLLNLGCLSGILAAYRATRTGAPLDDAEVERLLARRGFGSRLLRRFMLRVSAPWHMYPVGLLMGLGFDTATQVALLVLAGGTAALSLPWYAILVLPVLFAAGMTLFDATDGVLMARAYRWAFLEPARKMLYNLAVTATSAVAALGIGMVVLVQLLAEHTDLSARALVAVAGVDLEHLGPALAVLVLVFWLSASALARRKLLPHRAEPARRRTPTGSIAQTRTGQQRAVQQVSGL